MNSRKTAPPVIVKKFYLVAYDDGTPADLVPGTSGEMVRRFIVQGGKQPVSVKAATDEDISLYAVFNGTTVEALKELLK